MLYILLTIIAIGVLLLSDPGKKLLGLIVGGGVIFTIIALFLILFVWLFGGVDRFIGGIGFIIIAALILLGISTLVDKVPLKIRGFLRESPLMVFVAAVLYFYLYLIYHSLSDIDISIHPIAFLLSVLTYTLVFVPGALIFRKWWLEGGENIGGIREWWRKRKTFNKVS